MSGSCRALRDAHLSDDKAVAKMGHPELWRVGLGEGFFDGGGDAGIVGRHVRSEAIEDCAVAANEEFFEVPEDCWSSIWGREAVRLEVAGDTVAEAIVVDDVRGRGADELLVERMDARAFDGDLGEERKGDRVVGGAELGDFLVRSGFLRGEVVGGEAEYDEALGFELLVELFKGGVLRGEAALGGDVHDEEDFAGVVGERGG